MTSQLTPYVTYCFSSREETLPIPVRPSHLQGRAVSRARKRYGGIEESRREESQTLKQLIR